MPLKWERGQNPYLHTYFGRLRIGPNVPPAQIAQQAKQLKQSLSSHDIELGGRKLDEHTLSEAASKLMKEPNALAQELLLVHPLPRDESAKLKKACEEIRQTAVLPENRSPLPCVHPLAVFWFLPAPGPEATEPPAWEDFGFVAAGDEADLALDIIFDS
jgi:hypothetical protein